MGKASRRERGTKRADTQAAVQTDVVAGGCEHDRQYYALDWCSALPMHSGGYARCPSRPYPA